MPAMQLHAERCTPEDNPLWCTAPLMQPLLESGLTWVCSRLSSDLWQAHRFEGKSCWLERGVQPATKLAKKMIYIELARVLWLQV